MGVHFAANSVEFKLIRHKYATELKYKLAKDKLHQNHWKTLFFGSAQTTDRQALTTLANQIFDDFLTAQNYLLTGKNLKAEERKKAQVTDKDKELYLEAMNSGGAFSSLEEIVSTMKTLSTSIAQIKDS